MSQIETIMLVTLGFVVAALLALFLSRLVWSYGVTLGKRRTERSAPATIAALQAERDQLRAESAMLSRKLELRLDDLKTRLAEQTAEVSRNRNRIDHLIKEVEKRNAAITEREEQIEQLNRHIEPLEAELATRTQAMQQLKEQVRDRDDELSSTTSGKSKLEVEIAERDRELAQLRAELSDRDAKHKEISIEAQTAQERLQSQIGELTALSNQIEQQRLDMSAQFDEFAKLKSEKAAPETQDKPEPAASTPARKPKATRKAKSAARKTARGASKAEKTAMVPESTPPGTTDDVNIEETENNVDDQVKNFESKGHALEQQIRDAERETDQLQDELKKLDKVWAEKIAALSNVAPKTVKKRAEPDLDANAAGSDDEDQATDDEQPKPEGRRSRHNVISLAARIRALQGKSAEN